MVMLSRYRGRDFFWDPFCGSGTIPIEAALIALNRAPGLHRSFAAQQWDFLPPAIWQQAQEEAKDLEFRGDYQILGSDLDPQNIALSQANAAKAGVGKWIRFQAADATKMSLPAERGRHCLQPALWRADAGAKAGPAVGPGLRPSSALCRPLA